MVFISVTALETYETIVSPNTWGSHSVIIFGVQPQSKNDNAVNWLYDLHTNLRIQANGDAKLTYSLIASEEELNQMKGDSSNSESSKGGYTRDVTIPFIQESSSNLSSIRCGNNQQLELEKISDLPGTRDALLTDNISGDYSALKTNNDKPRESVYSYKSTLAVMYKTVINRGGSRYKTGVDSGRKQAGDAMKTEECDIPASFIRQSNNNNNPIAKLIRTQLKGEDYVLQIPEIMLVNEAQSGTFQNRLNELHSDITIIDDYNNTDEGSGHTLSSNNTFKDNYGIWTHDSEVHNTGLPLWWTDMPTATLIPRTQENNKNVLLTYIGLSFSIIILMVEDIGAIIKEQPSSQPVI